MKHLSMNALFRNVRTYEVEILLRIYLRDIELSIVILKIRCFLNIYFALQII